MKKYLSFLLVAAAIQLAAQPVALATPLSEKVKAVQSKPAKLDINSASAAELESLPGIGAKKAQLIVEYRDKIGKFTTVQDLSMVKGIGDKMVTRLQKVAVAN